MGTQEADQMTFAGNFWTCLDESDAEVGQQVHKPAGES
jgi:hypothetical protein